jgi:HK97 family phage prohead protease
MLKAVGILSTSAPLKGIVVDLRGVEVGEHIPVLDSHDFRNGCLGHLARAWVDDGALWGELQFTGHSGRRAYRAIERGSLNGVSCGFRIESVAICDSDGDEISVEEALERGPDDPDLTVIATHTTLREVSITSVPADRNACVRACSIDGAAWACIRDGERALDRILRPPEYDRDDDDVDDGRLMSVTEYIEARRIRC